MTSLPVASSPSTPMSRNNRLNTLNNVISATTIMIIGMYTVNDVPNTGTMVIFDISRLKEVRSVAGTLRKRRKLYPKAN